VLKRLSIRKGWFCEFGAWNGKKFSNTYHLIKGSDNWKGVMIEGDKKKYKSLEKNMSKENNEITTINKFVKEKGKDSVDEILTTTKIPKEFDLLSIDVDGPDYHIWKSMKEYRPKVVVIEINSEIGPHIKFVSNMRFNGRYEINPDITKHRPNFDKVRKWEKIRLFGTSFMSMVELGYEKEYTPVSCTKNNLILLSSEFLEEINIPKRELKNPSLLFKDEWAEGVTPIFPSLKNILNIFIKPKRKLQIKVHKKGTFGTAKEIINRICCIFKH